MSGWLRWMAKASGVACLRAPDPARPGRFASRVWDHVPATRAQIAGLGRELLRCQVQVVTLESTSDYWRIWYYVLESAGLAVQLVSPSQAKNLKGRPKTDKLDAMWLARLTQWGMLRPSFVPPAEIRRVRDFTRARTDLVRERTRCLQRLEKLLEDAMIKITSVARDGMKAKSVVAMVAALAAGERDPRTLADLARGPLRGKRDQLAEALDGLFDSHHGVIAQMLLGQVAFLDQQSTQMEEQAIAALARVPQSWGTDATGETGPGCGTSAGSSVLAAAHRLAEIPGVSLWLAVVIIAEIGLDMSVFPTPAHLVSWMGLCRSAAQSGTRNGKGKPKKGNSYARAAAGQAVTGAARTATFLAERYRRIARRRGKAIAQTAVARSIMIIAWHLLSTPPPATATSARTTTPATSTGTRRSPATSAACTPSASPSPSPPTTRPPRHPPPAPAGLWPGPEPPPRPGPRPARPGAGPLPRSGRAGFTWSDDGLSRERCLQDLDGGGCHLISGGS